MHSRQLVNVNVFIAQLGFCCVYFVFISDNLQDVRFSASQATLQHLFFAVLSTNYEFLVAKICLDAYNFISYSCTLFNSSPK